MKIKKLLPMQRVAFMFSAVMVVAGFLIISQMYFTYSEARAMSDACFDTGGFPMLEKSLLSIESFNCDLNP